MRERYSEMAAKQASKKAPSPRVFGQRRKHLKMFRVGLYARVSTFDQHTIPLQIRALCEYAARRGWTIAMQVKEVRSGNYGKSCWTRLAAARLTSCWCGDWIAGGGRWRTCSRHSRNWTISE